MEGKVNQMTVVICDLCGKQGTPMDPIQKAILLWGDVTVYKGDVCSACENDVVTDFMRRGAKSRNDAAKV